MTEIRPADFPHELPLVRKLFHEYSDGLGIELCFQGFEGELAGLPGQYAPPGDLQTARSACRAIWQRRHVWCEAGATQSAGCSATRADVGAFRQEKRKPADIARPPASLRWACH